MIIFTRMNDKQGQLRTRRSSRACRATNDTTRMPQHSTPYRAVYYAIPLSHLIHFAVPQAVLVPNLTTRVRLVGLSRGYFSTTTSCKKGIRGLAGLGMSFGLQYLPTPRKQGDIISLFCSSENVLAAARDFLSAPKLCSGVYVLTCIICPLWNIYTFSCSPDIGGLSIPATLCNR